jgi:acetylornithine deacetylase
MNWLTEPPKELLKAVVRFPSLSTKETPLVDWLEAEINALNLVKVERYGDNLVFSLGSGAPWLMLNSHTDVVPPSPNHIGDPFEPVERDGKLYGRGTVDAKGCGVSMLRALLELAEAGYQPKGKVSVALTICEETAGEHNGMHHLRHVVGLRPDMALIGEPTMLAPCLAQKGMLLVNVVTHGESGHAARVTGENAIVRMGEAIGALSRISFDAVNPWLGTVKITPTLIRGGTVMNANPEVCELNVDIRTIPEVPNSEILDTLRSHIPGDVHTLSDRFVATQTDANSVIAQACLRHSVAPFFGSPTASDWVFLADIPCVKIGPGDSTKSHTADEHIDIAQLEAAIPLYKSIIQDVLS